MISIIIPTLNEEAFLPKTLWNLFEAVRDKEHVEVIVVDAGSQDQTVQQVRHMDVRIFECPQFVGKKYASMNFGAHQAKGEIIVFLDADTRLPSHFDVLILNALKKRQTIGGAFEFSFDSQDWKLRLLTIANRIRYRFGKVFYGDQAVFVKKDALQQIGGVPEEALMETAYLCKELRSVGELELVRPGIRTSPRRFLTHGFFKTTWFDFNMFIRFKLGIPVSPFGEKYWSKNLIIE